MTQSAENDALSRVVSEHADTLETQQARVEAVKAAGHVAIAKVELGYTRRVCSRCRSNWPCPDYAQAAEWHE